MNIFNYVSKGLWNILAFPFKLVNSNFFITFGHKRKTISENLILLMMQRKRNKPSESKIRNATPNEYNGIKFKSKLETYTYKKLEESNIKAEYETQRYELLPAFTFGNKKYRAITYKPDFVGDKFIIECKGYPNDAWALREKLFKYYLYVNNLDIDYYIVHTQKQVDELVNKLKT